ncbi:MAG: DMT family transporter [Candidatus Cloacimonetes bacterium]|nr:DMT family transporter [Candidatus Cloacimonadota bacterium]
MTDKGKGLLAINLAVLLFGTAGLFGKLLTFSPILIVLGRVFFASIALFLFLLLKKDFMTIKKKASHYFFMLILGILLGIHWLTFFHAIQISTVAIGLLSFSTFPVYVAFLEPIIFKERFSIKYIVLALVSFIGIRLLIPRFELTDNILQGVIWGSLSGLLFAFLTLLNRKMVSYYRAGTVALYQNLIAFLVLLPFSLSILQQVNKIHDIIMLIVLGVVFTALSHTLFIYGLKIIKAKTASIIACLEPVYGILFAFLILSEIPEVRTIVGGMIIIGAVMFTTFTLKQKKKKYIEV